VGGFSVRSALSHLGQASSSVKWLFIVILPLNAAHYGAMRQAFTGESTALGAQTKKRLARSVWQAAGYCAE
jgi:hypothetical protein